MEVPKDNNKRKAGESPPLLDSSPFSSPSSSPLLPFNDNDLNDKVTQLDYSPDYVEIIPNVNNNIDDIDYDSETSCEEDQPFDDEDPPSLVDMNEEEDSKKGGGGGINYDLPVAIKSSYNPYSKNHNNKVNLGQDEREKEVLTK